MALYLRTELLKVYSDMMLDIIRGTQIPESKFKRMDSKLREKDWFKNFKIYEFDTENQKKYGKSVFIEDFKKLYEHLVQSKRGTNEPIFSTSKL